MLIREEQVQDQEPVRAVHRRAFGAEHGDTIAELVDALRRDDPTAGFRKPSLRIPDRAFQVIKLSAYEPWMTGTFVYSNTFWRLDCVGARANKT
ncbi:hypothetical protein [Micromonospora sp. DT233]|uniref:hypothetical protein n=1 Tax=Micromonospora sp. DT233 TaxID=3393432 RepID=UPI003CF1FCFC